MAQDVAQDVAQEVAQDVAQDTKLVAERGDGLESLSLETHRERKTSACQKNGEEKKENCHPRSLRRLFSKANNERYVSLELVIGRNGCPQKKTCQDR